jgi:hypothetical protein
MRANCTPVMNHVVGMASHDNLALADKHTVGDTDPVRAPL